MMKSRRDISKEVIVLGPHRSGTSMTAGILSMIGVDMGDNLLDADAWNVRGYFEDAEIEALNRNILKQLGGSWDDLPEQEEIPDELHNEIKSVVEKRRKKKIWGWKDPRTVFTLPYFFDLLENPHLVICCRNPADVAESLSKRGKKNMTQAFSLTAEYNREIATILAEHPGTPHTFVRFRDIVHDPIREARKLAEFVGLPLSDKTIRMIEQFILSKDQVARERLLHRIMRKIRHIISLRWLRP